MQPFHFTGYGGRPLFKLAKVRSCASAQLGQNRTSFFKRCWSANAETALTVMAAAVIMRCLRIAAHLFKRDRRPKLKQRQGGPATAMVCRQCLSWVKRRQTRWGLNF